MRETIGAIDIAYEDTGRGPALVLLHGFPLGRRMWQPQLQHLLGSMRIIAPDLRGQGDTTMAAGPISMEQMADDVAALLDARGVSDPVVLCGHSMGGYVALEFVHKYPQRVAALLLAATRAAPDSEGAQAARDASIAAIDSAGTQPVIAKMLSALLTPENQQKTALMELLRRTMEKTPAKGMQAALAAMKARPDARPWLAAIHAPTLVLHGAQDSLIAPAEAEAMARAIPKARFTLLEGAAHLPNLEQSALFNTAVRQLVKSVRAG